MISFRIILCTIVLINVKLANSNFLKEKILRALPRTSFEYYKVDNSEQVNDLSTAKPGQKIYFIIHGFNVTFEGVKKAREIKDEIFNHKSDKVHAAVVVNWQAASRLYRVQTALIVDQIEKELQRLYEKQVLVYENTVLAGMSLGGHIAGQVGKATQKKGHTIGRIDGIEIFLYIAWCNYLKI